MSDVDDLYFFTSDSIEHAVGKSPDQQHPRVEVCCWPDFGKVGKPVDHLHYELLDANRRQWAVLA